MHLGKLISFDSGTYTATVELRGSRVTRLSGVAVNRGLPAAQMIAGRSVAVWLAGDGPASAVILAVW